ncbi:MAG: PilT protein-like protein [Parcubacteria group bacterium Gr01-1014_70]|nr:MAG: PilT protein-like protein [Parcubacteria group bacterium Gr01-1014_70]
MKNDEYAAPALSEILTDPTLPVYVSTITEAELFSFSRLTKEETKWIEDFLGVISRVPVDSQIARAAGHIRSIYHLKLPDSIIAATTLFTGSTLLTRNVSDFKKIPSFPTRPI